MLRRVTTTVGAVLGEQYCVILGPDAEAIVAGCALDRARVLINPRAESGLSSSLALAAAHTPATADALLVVLGDQPAITPDDLQRLLAAWQRQPEHAAVSAYAQIIGAPCILPRSLFPALLELTGDRGAQAVLRTLPALHTVEMPNAALDIDTAADLERWTAQRTSVTVESNEVEVAAHGAPHSN